MTVAPLAELTIGELSARSGVPATLAHRGPGPHLLDAEPPRTRS